MRMQFLISTIAILTASSAFACPNLSGEYQFEKAWNGSLVVTQTNCSSVQVQFVRPNETRHYVATLITDGQPYEKSWDANMNSVSKVPATANSSSFDRVVYSGNQLVWREFDGNRATCEGKYNFTSFDCKAFEHTLGYDDSAKTFIWTQVGFWRGADGRYEDDTFILKKIR